MTVTTTPQQARTSYDEWLDRRWRWTGALVGLLALVVAALLVANGEKRSGYGDLLDAVARGEVDQVGVVGLGDDLNWSGYRTVELHWSGLPDRWAEVVVVRGGDAPPTTPGQVVTDGDPRDVLRAIDPDLRLTSTPHAGSSGSFMDWQAPGAVVLTGLATWLAVLLLVVGGPEPWRATRWAWGWVVLLAGPLGSVAYLLLGGPTGLLRPQPGHRRLTGGWAFLLAWFLFAGWRETNGG